MAHQIPYEGGTFKPDNTLIPGNATSDNPVEFDLVPAGGANLARLKSIIFASAGLVEEGWSPAMQAAVISAFESGVPVFAECVTAVRGLTVPAALAVRVGVLKEIPVRADATGAVRPDPKAPVPIVTGEHFARIAGFQTALALDTAFEIMKLSKQVNDLDPRLFVRPSGSPSTETPAGPSGIVPSARKRHGRHGTAA